MSVIIHQGDVLEELAKLPDDSIDCVVTSPPYWGLRDYGVERQIGLEPTLGEHLDVMVTVFAEVHRVLKPSGTCFVNYGDCYATAPNGRSAADTKAAGGDDRTFRDKPFSTVQGVLKPKDLCMVPNRFAIALQEWGWWVRSEIIWAKPNPMPESVKDRPATAHEKIFMLTKAQRYHWDAQAVRQSGSTNTRPANFKRPEGWDDQPGAHGSVHRNGRTSKSTLTGGPHGKSECPERYPNTEGHTKQVRDKQRGHGRRHDGFNDRWDQMTKAAQQQNGRNLRNYEPAPIEVWPIATRPFKDAHFATFPPELVERCLKAGCPKDGVVLDPFGGAGTTGIVARFHGHTCHLIELSPDYVAIIERRLASNSGPLLDMMDAAPPADQADLLEGSA